MPRAYGSCNPVGMDHIVAPDFNPGDNINKIFPTTIYINPQKGNPILMFLNMSILFI